MTRVIAKPDRLSPGLSSEKESESLRRKSDISRLGTQRLLSWNLFTSPVVQLYTNWRLYYLHKFTASISLRHPSPTVRQFQTPISHQLSIARISDIQSRQQISLPGHFIPTSSRAPRFHAIALRSHSSSAGSASKISLCSQCLKHSLTYPFSNSRVTQRSPRQNLFPPHE